MNKFEFMLFFLTLIITVNTLTVEFYDVNNIKYLIYKYECFNQNCINMDLGMLKQKLILFLVHSNYIDNEIEINVSFLKYVQYNPLELIDIRSPYWSDHTSLKEYKEYKKFYTSMYGDCKILYKIR